MGLSLPETAVEQLSPVPGHPVPPQPSLTTALGSTWLSCLLIGRAVERDEVDHCERASACMLYFLGQ